MKLIRVLVLVLLSISALSAQPAERNVVLVTIDGLRWQEFFGGADQSYFKRNARGEIEAAAAAYDAPTPEARRAILMPFMWNVVARQGQVFGDPSRDSTARVTNGLWFSYPGYNELFTGAPDPRIDSNAKVPNPNVTVFEWLNRRPGFGGRVAAFGSWDVLPFMLNAARSGLKVTSGWNFGDMARDLPKYWEYGPFDAPVVHAALTSLRTDSPRVLYLMLGEGDEWAHEGRYRLYLDAATRADRFIERLWTALQNMPAYRGRTTLLITTDHGRGATTKDWTDHGREVPAAERTWIAAIGPDVPALGIRRGVDVTAAQIAATVAAAVGEDFNAFAPKAAPPIPFR